jgi:hypothetical protein
MSGPVTWPTSSGAAPPVSAGGRGRPDPGRAAGRALAGLRLAPGLCLFRPAGPGVDRSGRLWKKGTAKRKPVENPVPAGYPSAKVGAFPGAPSWLRASNGGHTAVLQS